VTGIVRSKFAKMVNLRHFFMPLVCLPHTMRDYMLQFDSDGNLWISS